MQEEELSLKHECVSNNEAYKQHCSMLATSTEDTTCKTICIMHHANLLSSKLQDGCERCHFWHA